MNYFKKVFVGLSQLTNAVMGGNPNELLSARAYRTNNSLLVSLINSMFFDSNHCKKAFEFELRNEQLPEYKNLCLLNKDNLK